MLFVLLKNVVLLFFCRRVEINALLQSLRHKSKFGIPNFPWSPDIGQGSDIAAFNLRISGYN